MSRGPKINIASQFRDVPGEDQLGIKYVAINISDVLQNGITSITPRARYWSFYTWVLYDFIMNANIKKTEANFKAYIKKQEWYFILANIAYGIKTGDELNALQGVSEGSLSWADQSKNSFEINHKYIANSFGGYAAYRNVLKTVGLTSDPDPARDIQIDCITKTGEVVALAFEEEIRNTQYYKEFRLSDKPVPRHILQEYGEKVHLSNAGYYKDGRELIEIFLPTTPSNQYSKNRKASLQFYRFILNHQNVRKMTASEWRHMFYDVYSMKANPSIQLEDEYKQVAIGWEICTARMFFTYALEGIWARALLKMADASVDMGTLIGRILEDFDHNMIELPLSKLICEEVLKDTDRDDIVQKLRNPSKETIYAGIMLAIDVYNRISDRDDFDEFHKWLLQMGDEQQISLQHWINVVNQFKEKRVGDFLEYILKNFIFMQHQKTALEKLYTTRNQTFHFIQEDGILHWLANDQPAFNVMRVVQGSTVLNDLDLI